MVAGLALEDSIARLAPALEQMRLAVHQYGGIIHREMGDGVFAVFGAPVANDLHAVMACFAALELLRRIEALGDEIVRVRIGVHSGLVLAGPRQLDYTRMYDFDGPPLILAERLQAAAKPGQALASQATRALAKGYIEFGPAEEHTLKGFAEPVRVFPIRGVEQISKWQVTLGRGTTGFVGREAESRRLLSLAHSAAAAAGHVVVVSGEPGVGKSRLVREVLHRLRDRAWQTIEAECSPIVGQSPFFLLKHVLAGAISLLDQSQIAELKAELPAAELDAMRLIVEGAAAESLPNWARLASRARARAIVEMACALVARRVDSRPTILLLEDAQWADGASALAFQAICGLAERLPLLILVTARAAELPAWFDEICSEKIVLAPLERQAALAMLDQLLGPSPRLLPLKTQILDHTGAMPLFVEEVCRGLVESGELIGGWGAFEPRSDKPELGVPLTVQGVIASRIDRLSPREKRVLQVAATIGPQVPSRLLRAISALEVQPFRQILAGLLAAGMLIYPASSQQDEACFPHECVRQVAYDATLEPERVRLHKRILIELEAEAASPSGRDGLAAIMVHHAIQAKEWFRAAELATAIARRSFVQSAFVDAKRYFELAMTSVDKLPHSAAREANAIDLRIEARMAYGNLGLVSRWLDLAREAETRAIASGDHMRQIPALAMRAAALNFCGTPAEALEAGEAAVREAARSGQLGWLAYAEYGLGQARYVAGRYVEAVDVLERAFRRFRVDGASPPPGGGAAQAALLSSMMICVSKVALGDLDGAGSAQEQADAIAYENGGPAAAIAAGFSRGVLLLARRNIDAAEESLARSLALAHRHEVHLFVPVLANQHGLAQLQLARLDEAREAFRIAHEEAELLGHRSAALRAELGLALCDCVNSSKRSAALAAIQRCGQSARQGGYQTLELEALLIGNALVREMGGEAPAEAAAKEMVRRLGAKGIERDMRRLLELLLSA